MPLFKYINPTPDTADATYAFAENPDPERFVEVTEAPAAPAEAPAPVEAPTPEETN